ncbi:MAG: S41 family peptidase, partial [Spirochaetes bacterium]|nr:S41 family peptidase [Spirochaetota bacterium]
MKRLISERSFHYIFVAFLIGLFVGISLSIHLLADEPAHRYLDYFHQVYNYIVTDYVDTAENKRLFYGAIRGMLRALDDPYSRFLDENDFRSFKEDISGDFFGVGLEIAQKNGNTVVIAPIEDSPAMKAGIQSGDIITKINDISVKNKTIDELVNMIRGKPNTTVRIEIKREGIDSPLEFELRRTKIHTKSVNFAIIDGHATGYLRIKIFGDDTHREVENALRFFTTNGIAKLIIDLRGNPGGKLDEAIAIADFFLEKGALIVSTKGKKGTAQNQEARAQTDPLYRGKIVVLINHGSASAAEILAAALRDNKKATLVGEKTFGKGSVQRLFELSEMVGITLT